MASQATKAKMEVSPQMPPQELRQPGQSGGSQRSAVNSHGELLAPGASGTRPPASEDVRLRDMARFKSMPIDADFVGEYRFYDVDQGQEIVTQLEQYVTELEDKQHELALSRSEHHKTVRTLHKHSEELLGKIKELQKDLAVLEDDIAAASAVASHSDKFYNRADNECKSVKEKLNRAKTALDKKKTEKERKVAQSYSNPFIDRSSSVLGQESVVPPPYLRSQSAAALRQSGQCGNFKKKGGAGGQSALQQIPVSPHPW